MSMGLYQRYNKVYQRYKKQFKSGFIFETQQPVQDPQAAEFSVILIKIYKFSDIKSLRVSVCRDTRTVMI